MPLHTAEGSRRRLGYGVRVCACSVYKLLFVCALHVACVCIYNYIFHVCTEIYKYGAMSEYNSDLESGRVCARVRPSLYIAVTVGPVGFSHVHAAHRQAHAVDGVTPRRHPLVDAVQTFGLLKTADPVLRGEASDGCRDTQTHRHTKKHDKRIHAG